MNEERDKDRADIEWLEARERGDTQLPPIAPERAEAYDKMQLEISSLPLMSAPEGWDALLYAELELQELEKSKQEAKRKSQRSIALLNATEKEEEKQAEAPKSDKESDRVVPVTRISDAKKSKRWGGVVASVAAIAAVAAGAMILVREKPESRTEIAGKPEGLMNPIAMISSSGQERRSASEGVIGETISMSAVREEGELRLYLNSSDVVARCGAKCATSVSDGLWRYETTLPNAKRGTYHLVFLACRNQDPSGSLDDDIERCPGGGRVWQSIEIK